MTGMKKGAGEDPFADDNTEPQPTTNDTQSDPAPEQKQEDTEDTNLENQQQLEIPYKFRRDGVKDNRDRVPLFLQEDTKRAERKAQRELEGRFDDSVSLTDLREALVKVGLENLDDVEDQLESWGYGMTFE